MSFLIRLLVNAAALWVATQFVTGVTYHGAPLPFVAVALVFGLVNAVIRPILKFFTFPFFILTLGLFAFVLNALMLWLTSALSSAMRFSKETISRRAVTADRNERSIAATNTARRFDFLMAQSIARSGATTHLF